MLQRDYLARMNAGRKLEDKAGNVVKIIKVAAVRCAMID